MPESVILANIDRCISLAINLIEPYILRGGGKPVMGGRKAATI